MEQRNDTFIEMGIYDDGPFELGDENEKNPELVPAPVNSYLGKMTCTVFMHSLQWLYIFILFQSVFIVFEIDTLNI